MPKIAEANAEADLARRAPGARPVRARPGIARSIDQREQAARTADDDLKASRRAHSGRRHFAEELRTLVMPVTTTRATSQPPSAIESDRGAIDGTTIADHPQGCRGGAVRNAALALHRTDLIAAGSGVIAKRSVQVGATRGAGTPLWRWCRSTMCDRRQLQGGSARAHARRPTGDGAHRLYGGAWTYHGACGGHRGGQRATPLRSCTAKRVGQLDKIVQRLPVRILWTPRSSKRIPLRVGLSTAVRDGSA